MTLSKDSRELALISGPQRLIARRRYSFRLKALLAVATIAMFLTRVNLMPAQADTDNSAMVLTQTMVNHALEIMANKSLSLQQRRRQLRESIENDFDFTEMSRSALGYNWRSLTPEQRSHFTQLFTAFIEDAYLSKIQDYSGQKVQFQGQTPLGTGYTQINTAIVQPDKSPIQVNYLLLQKGDSWKVYDVTVDAISIIANYRNQFNRVINEKGFDQLLADLQAKQQELASLLGR
jgi:phospholipid transport system substrate-binding protein